MSALQTLAKPRRIKATHRRRRRAASGQSVQRYYDPQCGCFLSVDPVTASSVNGSNFNRYWYASNNPYRFTDPDGRLDCRACRSIVDGVKNQIHQAQAGIEAAKSQIKSELQQARNYVSTKDLTFSWTLGGMAGAPMRGNGITPGLTILGDAGVVVDLKRGQVGIQVDYGTAGSVGGGATIGHTGTFGLNEGPLKSGTSVSDIAFFQVNAVPESGAPVNIGYSLQHGDDGSSVGIGLRGGFGEYIGAGVGKVVTRTWVNNPLW